MMAAAYTIRRDEAAEQMLTTFVNLHPPDDLANSSFRRIEAAAVAEDDTDGSDAGDDAETKFGWLPIWVARLLEDSEAQVYMTGGDELKKCVAALSQDMMFRVDKHLLSFLRYLSELPDGRNVRFTLSVLESIEIIVVKLSNHSQSPVSSATSADPSDSLNGQSQGSNHSVVRSANKSVYIRNVLAIVIKPLADNCDALRHSAFRIIVLLTQTLQKPMLVIDQLVALNFHSHRNSKVRAETLNFLIVALLTYPSTAFDLAKTTSIVSTLLADQKRQVRLAAFECLAVLAQAFGAANRQILLNLVAQFSYANPNSYSLSQSQSHSSRSGESEDGDEVTLMGAVLARLARRQLPRLVRPSSEVDPHITYALQLPSAAQLRQMPLATRSADVRWIIATPSFPSSRLLSASSSASDGQSGAGNAAAMQAWTSTVLQQKNDASPTPASTPTESDVSPPLIKSNYDSMQDSAAKMRKLLPWEHEQNVNGSTDAGKSTNNSSSSSNSHAQRKQTQTQTQNPSSPSQNDYDDNADAYIDGDAEADANVDSIRANGHLHRAVHKNAAHPESPTITLNGRKFSPSNTHKQPDSTQFNHSSNRARKTSIFHSTRTTVSETNGEVIDSSPLLPHPPKEAQAKSPALERALVASGRRSASYQRRRSLSAENKSAELSVPALVKEPERPTGSEQTIQARPRAAFKRAAPPAYHSPTADRDQLPTVVTIEWAPNHNVSSPYRSIDAAEMRVTTNKAVAGRPAEAEESEMAAAIQSIRNSAAKKRAAFLARMQQADNDSRSAPPRAGQMSNLQHQFSLPSAKYTDDDFGPFEYSDEEDEELNVGDDESDEEFDSSSKIMSKTLVQSLNRKQQQLMKRQMSLLEPGRSSEVQRLNASASQSALSSLRKPPPLGAAQKNTTLGRPAFDPNHGGMTHSKSAGAICSADDEQMLRDIRFLSDKQPPELLRIALNGIGNPTGEQWDDKCRCLNIIRFLAREHTAFLIGEYRNIRLPILREVRNLRTQVNRLALRTFGELFEHLGKVTETDLDGTIEQLLPRTGDTNKFIQQEVQDTLMRLVRFVSPVAAIPVLIRYGSTHRNQQVRAATAQFVAVAVQRYVTMQTGRTSLYDETLAYGEAASSDAGPTCRQYGRQIVAALSNGSSEDKLDSNNNDSMRKQQNGGSNGSSLQLPKGAANGQKKLSVGMPPLLPQSSELLTITADLQASDWQTRLRGVLAYQQYVLMCVDLDSEATPNHVRAFQQFSRRLYDSNAKVNFAALQALRETYSTILTHVAFEDADGLPLSVCIDGLLPNLASADNRVFTLSNEIIDNFVGDLLENATELIEPICTHYKSLQDDKFRAYLLEKLSYIVPRTYAKRRNVIHSKLIPFFCDALNDVAPQLDQRGSAARGREADRLKQAFVKLLKSLHRQMKESLAEMVERNVAGKVEISKLLHSEKLTIKQLIEKLAN